MTPTTPSKYKLPMATGGKWWYHLIFNTLGSWLPGDSRGFRSRNHKIHSSGDYRHPPPPSEHDGLYRYSKKLCPDAVRIPVAARSVAGQAIVEELAKQEHHLLVLSVGLLHAHLLVEMPRIESAEWDIVGNCKRVSSHAVRLMLPGRVWGRKGRITPIHDKPHQLNVYHYILNHKDQGAWVWSFKEGIVFDSAAP